MTFAATRCILWALSASKMHLQSGLYPEPCWGGLQRSPRPFSWWERGSLQCCPSRRTIFPLSAFGPHDCSPDKFWLCPWVLRAIKIAAKSFVSKRRLKNTGLVDCMVGLITVWPLLLLTVLTYKGMHKLDRLSLSGCLVTYRDGLTQFIETNALLLSQTTT